MRILDFAFGAVSSLAAVMFFWPTPPHEDRAASISDGFQESDCSAQKDSPSHDECRFKLTPKTITIRFVSREQFAHEAPPNSDAFSYIAKNPCEIVIPIGASIISIAKHGRAVWDFGEESFKMQQILPHEILHCYTGRWHPDAPTLYMTEARERIEAHRDTVHGFIYRLHYLSRQSWEKLGFLPGLPENPEGYFR
jgi:hypothetical protein